MILFLIKHLFKEVVITLRIVVTANHGSFLYSDIRV